jgi:hypothetical protein
MGVNENELIPLEVVDDALRTYPLEPAPTSIFPTVMKRIEIQKSMPRFKLSWLDYALGSFFSMMIGLVLLLWQFASLPPHWFSRLQNEFVLWWQRARLLTIQFQPQFPTEFVLAGMILLMFGLIFITRKRAPLVRIPS